MKYVFYSQYGGPEVLQLGECPIPEISEDEVLIQIAACSYNALDGSMRKGIMGPVKLPHVPHMDFSGVIAKAGSNVSAYSEGDRVVGVLLPDYFRDSCAQEYVALNPNDVVIHKAPSNLSLCDAGALVGAGLTAYQGLTEHLKVREGERVLINGAAGGVGHYAIQIAKALGCTVVASDSAKNQNFMKEIGADEVVDYSTDAVYAPVDAAFNAAPIPADAVTKLLSKIVDNGRIVSTLNPPDSNEAQRRGITSIRMAVHSSAEDIDALVKLVESGKVRPYITGRYRLETAADMHVAASGSHGKLILEVNSSL